MEGIAALLYSRADGLVVLGLAICGLTMLISVIVLVASDGNRTAPFGPYPFFLLFCSAVFSGYISWNAANADSLFENASNYQAKVEHLFEIAGGFEKGSWVAFEPFPMAKFKSVRLLCPVVQPLAVSGRVPLEISPTGLIRQQDCSFLKQLNFANLYSRWWQFAVVLVLLLVFARIEEAVYWRKRSK